MYLLFLIPCVSVALVVWLALNEKLWFGYIDKPMLEQIEDARKTAVYDQYSEVELVGQC